MRQGGKQTHVTTIVAAQRLSLVCSEEVPKLAHLALTEPSNQLPVFCMPFSIALNFRLANHWTSNLYCLLDGKLVEHVPHFSSGEQVSARHDCNPFFSSVLISDGGDKVDALGLGERGLLLAEGDATAADVSDDRVLF